MVSGTGRDARWDDPLPVLLGQGATSAVLGAGVEVSTELVSNPHRGGLGKEVPPLCCLSSRTYFQVAGNVLVCLAFVGWCRCDTLGPLGALYHLPWATLSGESLSWFLGVGGN